MADPRHISIEPLTAAAFAPYGDVLDTTGEFRLINEGLCQRHHDLARLDFTDGQSGISIFKAQIRALPYALNLIERHPLGSQAFIPMSEHPFLVIVSDGPKTKPRAFRTNGHQAINLHRGTWHGVLTPLHEPGLFAVIDRIGEGKNLEEFRFPEPWFINP